MTAGTPGIYPNPSIHSILYQTIRCPWLNPTVYGLTFNPLIEKKQGCKRPDSIILPGLEYQIGPPTKINIGIDSIKKIWYFNRVPGTVYKISLKAVIVLLHPIISRRRLVQALVGIILLTAVVYFKISLLYILLIGIIVGIIFGKVFCRWMCPLGFMMELMIRGNFDVRQEQLYNYHKLGCPIAWVSGWLNKYSLFKIKRDPSKCVNCGLCDQNCYITTFEPEYSNYEAGKKTPSTHFSCSKCLICVAKCPTRSLQYKL